ncbi:hypothetical protein FB451DRAFT_1179522 [Mycena latifolia]|nr:hypothetical protein FB451DRAFT_1179522 [Mycena latifolia]
MPGRQFLWLAAALRPALWAEKKFKSPGSGSNVPTVVSAGSHNWGPGCDQIARARARPFTFATIIRLSPMGVLRDIQPNNSSILESCGDRLLLYIYMNTNISKENTTIKKPYSVKRVREHLKHPNGIKCAE